MPDNRMTSRRKVLLGGVAVSGLAALEGCCGVPKPPSQPTEPFLAGPEVLGAWKKPQRYFDAHTHFFNARDVPVSGFLEKSVAHSLPSPRVRALVRALAPIAGALASIAPDPATESRQLLARPRSRSLGAGGETAQLDAEITAHRDQVAEEMYRAILRSGGPIPQLIDDAGREARARSPREFRGQATRFDANFMREALRDGGSARDTSARRLRPEAATQLRGVEDVFAQMKGALQFVGFMLSPRHYNLRVYIQRMAEYSPSLPLSGCFAAMVDFNYWLDRPDRVSRLEDQVLLHEQLSLLSRGYLMPVVAYNPWVDIKENDASIALVERAVRQHGCVGAKIYPSMGFYPYGNASLPFHSPEPRPDPVLLDRKLAAFYALCDDLGIPVMAHANASNGRDAAHDALAGIVGWDVLRRQQGLLKGLSVDAGHFGGEHAHGGEDWTDAFVALMQREGPLHIYADLGYWRRLPQAPAIAAKLGRVLAVGLPSGGTVADRVLYGSDWHMLSKEPGWEAYAEQVASIIRVLDTTQTFADKILGGNALRCYGLDRETARPGRARLLRHFAAHVQPQGPGWMSV